MQVSFVKYLLLPLIFLPVLAAAQVTDRAESGGTIIPVTPDNSEKEPREFHITPILLESDEGKRALQELREFEAQDYWPLRSWLVMYNVGTIETFNVRNIQEGNEWDEVEFELVCTGNNIEIWVEVEELAEDKITDEILDVIWEGLNDITPPNSVDSNRGIVDISIELFGDLPDRFDAGVLKILITDIQDGWDPPEQNFFTAGFFDPVDQSVSNPNSNRANILYINSKPGIYRPVDGENRFVNSRLNTMAHELQHLIHANYGNLSLFQNEGQSELAEILTGYNARGMNFLDSGTEVSGNVEGSDKWVYRFRSSQSDVVLFDYQRAQLLHGYLEERVGAEAASDLTKSVFSNDAGYQQVLNAFNISLDEFFADFYITAYANNRVQGMNNFAFSRPQLSNVRTSNPGIFYNVDIKPWVSNKQETIYYGGALYTQWFGVEELTLDIHSTNGITQNILYRKLGDSEYRHMEAGQGVHELDEEGIYEEIVLISVNVQHTGTSASPGDNRTFSYSGEWATTNLTIEPLVYHADAAAFVSLPDEEAYSFALRISPDFDSGVQSVRFNTNARESAVQGNGELVLTLRRAVERLDEDNNLFYIPSSEVMVSQTIHVSDISTGSNYFGVNSSDWQIEAGEEYFITLEVVENAGNLYLEFLVDEGTESSTDPNYNPLRTFVGIQEDGELVGWASFQDKNNVLMGVNLVGFKDVGDIDFPGPPVADSFELIGNYPNPFNNGTVIQYNVPEPGQVQITVHDILGREVMELYNGGTSPGLHEVRFEAGSLASGLYFYRMQSPGGIQSKKMLLVK
jgi:hypothetical protein